MPAMVKKLLIWGLVVFVIFFIAYRPDAAANVFRSLGAVVVDIAQGMGDFFTSLVQ
ncbi:MAG: hypothetical protein FWJ93_15115 [Micromonosporaceae bacterium]